MAVRPVVAAAAAVLTGALGLVASVARGGTVEEPAYTVESTHEGWEVRRYAPTIEARVTVQGPWDAAVSDGFRVLAGYIFGGNAPQGALATTARRAPGQKIAMTAPVAATSAGEDAWIVAFTMPSSFRLDTLPTPLDPRVELVPVDGLRVAARPFGGWATEDRVAREQEALLAALRDAGLGAGPSTVAQYDPPWTPPPLRRNEILVPLSTGG
jgi:hypothetical protein